MRIRLRYLVVLLVILSILSLGLTFVVVFRPVEIFSPNAFTRNVTSTNQDASTQTRVTYALEDVFRPTRFIISNENKVKIFLMYPKNYDKKHLVGLFTDMMMQKVFIL